MSKLRSSEAGLFKIFINNERVRLPNHEYSIHHVYLHGFRKAYINVTLERVNGEVGYIDTPEIDIDNDTITFRKSEEPIIKHSFNEIIDNAVSNNTLNGLFEPLYARVSDENNLTVLINNKYIFNTSEIELVIEGTSSIINILIYPFKLLWIYSPKARVEIVNTNNKLLFKVEETQNNHFENRNRLVNEKYIERNKGEVGEKIESTISSSDEY